MRIKLPDRISPQKTAIFAGLLFCVQQLEHTSLLFSLLFFGFLIFAMLGFNVAGGFSRASGAYIFLFAVLTAGLGVTWKAVLGEPADSNLLVPQLDMAVYTASMFMLLLVLVANKKLTGHVRGISTTNLDYTLCALGCLVLGLAQAQLNAMGAGGQGSALSIINQLGQFFQLAIILGTIGAIKDSGGRRSINFISGAAIALVFIGSLMAFTKQGMLTPMACWVVGAAFMRFRLRLVHYVVIGSFAVFAFTVVPLIANGRNSIPAEGGTPGERLAVVYNILTHLGEAHDQAAETVANVVAFQGKSGYFNKPQGLIERLSILSADDTFFNYTNKGNYIGYAPVIAYYENFVPHFILPDKPVPISGNYYAHQIGGFLADNDYSTGISFSPMAEAYHVDGWVGIFLLLPAIWLSLFASVDYICGDLRRSPWGLLIVIIFAHAAAESLLGSLIWISVYGNLGIILAIVFCTHFAPVVGALFYGGNRLSERASPPMVFPRHLSNPIRTESSPWDPSSDWLNSDR